jgi:hypothetical protein
VSLIDPVRTQHADFLQVGDGQRVSLLFSLLRQLMHPLLTAQSSSDSLPHWPHPHHRSTKDDCFLLPTAKVERHSGLHRRHSLDLGQMAVDWLPGGTLWDIRLVWRLLRNYWLLRGKYTCGRTISTDGA